MHKRLRKYIAHLFLFIGIYTIAQQYPVKLNPVLMPPYSVRLADYATSSEEKVRLQVLLADLMQPSHKVNLRFSLESASSLTPIAATNPMFSGMQPFTIYPGTPLVLSNLDFRALFELQNLTGINAAQYSRPLPQGMYNFCFTAYDAVNNAQLSQKSCFPIYLQNYEPPFLTLPGNGEKVVKQNEFQNIIFQWMPRQEAPNTHYVFTLKEIWDTSINPSSAFLASRTLWQEKTPSKSFYYGIDKTALLEGKRYAWQVQAVSANQSTNGNIDPNDYSGVYQNNGLSEIFYFDYVRDCVAPIMLMAKNAGRGRAEIRWMMPNGQPQGLYNVQYRLRGSTADWAEQKSYQESTFLTGLADHTEYEYRVGSVCGEIQDYGNTTTNQNAYTYSQIQYFTTNSDDKDPTYQCGVMPPVDVTNKTPLTGALSPNQTFTAGDFTVTVIKSTGYEGNYSGEGFIVVPYLGDTKIKVVFNNIQVNSEKKLISGVVETTYDPNESAVSYASTGLGEMFGDQGIGYKDVKYKIESVEVVSTPPPGKIIITSGGSTKGGVGAGGKEELPLGKDYEIVDEDGVIWYIDEKGNVTKGGKVAAGGPSTSQNTEGVSGSGKNATVAAYTAKGVNLIWDSSDSKFAYDDASKADPKLQSQYPKVKDANGGNTYVSYKAVVNKASDPFDAKVTITDTNLVDREIIFKTLESGKEIKSTLKDGSQSTSDRTYRLNLEGTFSYATEQVIAVLMPKAKDSLSKQQVISSFNLVHLEPKTVDVSLVPLDQASSQDLDAQKKQLETIYGKVGVSFNVKKENVLDISSIASGDTIETPDDKALSTYSQMQTAINNLYKGTDAHYVLFVTNKKSSTGQSGYMRLNGQFGYVYNNAPTKTSAHELGHGVFKLEHPWSKYNTTQSATDLLMDYGSGTILNHLDWKQINDPTLKLYTFQGQSAGEFNGGYAITPNNEFFSVFSTTKVDITDYTIEKNKKYVEDGSLPGFKLSNGKIYVWNYDTNKYVSSTNNSDGVLDEYQLTPIDKSKLDKEKYIFLFFNKSNPCGLGTYKYVKAKQYLEFNDSLPAFVHANNDNKLDLPCAGNGTGSTNVENNNWKHDPNASENNPGEECYTTSFEYLSTPAENDINTIKEAFIRGLNSRKSIQNKEREQGKYNHILYVNNSGKEGSLEDIDKDDKELLEDKLHLLSYYKNDIYVGIVFLKRNYKQFYKADVVDKLALDVIKASKPELGGKKALLIVVPYTYKVSKETDCLPIGFGQTMDNDVVRYSSVKIDTDKKWMSKVLGIYKEVPKPLYVNRYYKMADGKIIQKSIKAENVTGRPFINTLTFYESKGYDDIRRLNDEYNRRSDFQTNLRTYQEYLQKANKIYFDRTSKEELEGSLENTNLWKSIPTNDLGKFREIYMDDVKLTNRLWEKSVDEWAWGSKVEIALNNPSEEVQLLGKHFYNFDKMTLVDDVIYGVVDGIGLIPGVDTFTDPIGAVYAGIRGDYTNAIVYSASFAVPLAGSAYVKGALKVGEDASQLVGIVARKADNADGYILEAKKISEIGANEVHVSSIYYGGDQKLTQKVLDGVRADSKYIDGDYVRKSLNELSGNFATLLSRIDNLPNLSLVERNTLKADINSSAELKNLFIKNIDKTDELSDVWKTLLNARGANSVLKKDVALINKVAELKKNNSFMQQIGGNEGLEKIIKNNVQAPCKSCGNSGSKYLKNMDEYLDDVEHFVTNFNDVSDAQRLIAELKNGAQNTVEGGAFSVRMFKENPGGLFTKGQVSAIDLRFSEDVLNRFDVKFVNGFGEFKSYQIESISNVSVNQLKQYLAAPDLTKLSDLNYFFDKRKLLQEFGTGTSSTIIDATGAVKDKFKAIFSGAKKQEIFDAIWSNPNLRNDLFEANITKADAKLDFDDLVNDTKSILYNFIKVQ